ncbi:MAG: peptidylprolyl isomerase [Thermodesulfobacteriota bacterium]
MYSFCRPQWLLVTGFVCVLVLGGALVSGAGQVVDRVVAVVNDDVIRLRELDRALEPVRQQLESRGLKEEQRLEEFYEAREQILDEMINEKLSDQQIQDSGIEVDESDVDAAIENVKQRNRYTDEDLRQALQMQGMSMEEYRSEIKQQMLRSRLVNRKVRSNIVVTDEDVRRYYEENPEEFGGEMEYKLRNILMQPPRTGDSGTADRVLARMNLILWQLEQGATFDRLAAEFSEATNASDGGELGQFSLQDLSENLRSVIGDLEEGEFSGVVDTEHGFQIFYVEDIITTPPEPLENVSDEIRKKLYDKRVNEKYNEWIKSLRQQAHIRIIR